MTGMTCTRCRTEDPSRSSSVSPRRARRARTLARLSLPPSIRSRRSSSSPSGSRSGYLLRGRCGLNLINSMRHLDKCAPRTRIQRIIFILIHLLLLYPPACLPPLDRSLTSFSAQLRSSSPLTASPREEPRYGLARTVSSVIRSPIHTRQARARCERAREGGREAGGKKDAFIRSHLAGIICLFDVAPYLIR